MDDNFNFKVMIIASGDLWAGAEVMIYQLVSGVFRLNAVHLVVVLMNHGKLAEELERLGVMVHIVDESTNSFLNSVCIVRRLIKEFAPDVIHSHRYKENVLAWCASRGLEGSRLVATQHGMPETVSGLLTKERFQSGLFFRMLTVWFDRTVLVSEEMRRSLVGRYGFADKNIIVIHNGIRVPVGEIVRSGTRVIVGAAGRLFPVKDFPLLVEVARVVVEQSECIDFVLAGDGPELVMLKELVGCYGLAGRFRLLGHQEDMAAFYAGLDIYINTSVHEGIPMSVLEAMSHGIPIVAPKVGGFPEILEDGVSGFLVAGRDPGMFAQRVLSLLYPEKRERMGRLARERVVTSFSQEMMVQRYLQLYKELSRR